MFGGACPECALVAAFMPCRSICYTMPASMPGWQEIMQPQQLLHPMALQAPRQEEELGWHPPKPQKYRACMGPPRNKHCCCLPLPHSCAAPSKRNTHTWCAHACVYASLRGKQQAHSTTPTLAPPCQKKLGHHRRPLRRCPHQVRSPPIWCSRQGWPRHEAHGMIEMRAKQLSNSACRWVKHWCAFTTDTVANG